MTVLSKNEHDKEVIPLSLLKILSNRNAVKIIQDTFDSPKTAFEISKDCNVSLTTTYRQLRRLSDRKIMNVTGTINERGKKNFTYESKKNVYCKCARSQVKLYSIYKTEGNS